MGVRVDQVVDRLGEQREVGFFAVKRAELADVDDQRKSRVFVGSALGGRQRERNGCPSLERDDLIDPERFLDEAHLVGGEVEEAVDYLVDLGLEGGEGVGVARGRGLRAAFREGGEAGLVGGGGGRDGEWLHVHWLVLEIAVLARCGHLLNDELRRIRVENSCQIFSLFRDTDAGLVVAVTSVRIHGIRGTLLDGWDRNLRLLEFLPVGCCTTLECIPFVADSRFGFVAGGQFFFVTFQMFVDGGILFLEGIFCFLGCAADGVVFVEWEMPRNKQEVEIAVCSLPPLYIAATQEGFDDFFGLRIGGDEFGAFFAIDDEGFVEAGFDPVVEAAIDIFSERRAGSAEFFEKGVDLGGNEAPAVFGEVGLGDGKGAANLEREGGGFLFQIPR